MTWTMPCLASPIGYSRMPNSAQLRRSVSIWVRLTGSAIGLVDVESVGTLWSSVRQREVGPADRAAGQPQPVERLRARDLVHEVHVDVQQVRLAGGAAHHVAVPELLGQRLAHASAARLTTCASHI